MKKYFYLTTCVFFIFFMEQASAQGNYVKHTLKTGETLSLLAKEYNTNVGDIMRLNGMHADSKLVYGSAIKIPSTKKNKTEVQQPQPAKQINVTANKNAAMHKVVKGETLYSISKQYNVSPEQIKAWNNLTDNSIKLGSNLIVGTNNAFEETSQTVSDTKRQRVETTQQTQTNNTIEPEQKSEAVNVVEKTNADNADLKTNNEVANNQPAAVAENSTLTLTSSTSFFENQYSSKSKHKKHVSGVSKTFKTSSGWSDGKYYILADNINPGTVVKLTADNGKSVYAKVLWNMSDLKESNDIDFRVSNATAAALNEDAASFNLTINY